MNDIFKELIKIIYTLKKLQSFQRSTAVIAMMSTDFNLVFMTKFLHKLTDSGAKYFLLFKYLRRSP